MGEVEEKRNNNPLLEYVKRAIIDFCNREYEENHSNDEFDVLYPDLKYIGIEYSFNDLFYVDLEDLEAALGLDIDDKDNFYVLLSKDLDNDGIDDRYDNDFRDSDYFESTYYVEGIFKAKKKMHKK